MNEKIFFTDSFNLGTILSSGQSFSWRKLEPLFWEGWMGESFLRARQEGNRLIFSSEQELEETKLRSYFQLDFSLQKVISTFPQDEWIEKALTYSPGLRLLRQEPWETAANFICSALKQIVQIEQINRALRHRFGREIFPGAFTFPDPEILAKHEEADLRACKLGFRAKHLLRAARQIAAGEIDLKKVETLSTSEARSYLKQLAGVGDKVANCILLFAYGRLEVFPIDVWVERVLRQLYFAKKRKVTSKKLARFADSYFGPHAGYAQQYLFHWIRTSKESACFLET